MTIWLYWLSNIEVSQVTNGITSDSNMFHCRRNIRSKRRPCEDEVHLKVRLCLERAARIEGMCMFRCPLWETLRNYDDRSDVKVNFSFSALFMANHASIFLYVLHMYYYMCIVFINMRFVIDNLPCKLYSFMFL